MRSWISAHGIALLLCVLAPQRAGAVGSRVSDLGPYLEPASSAELAKFRAEKAALTAGAPAAKVESGVADRVLLVGTAMGNKTRRISTDLANAYSSPGLPVDDMGRLYLRIDGAGIGTHAAELAALGIAASASAEAYGFIEAWVPYEQVDALARLSWVRRIALPGVAVAEIGSRLSEGDALHRADLARAAFSVDGTGARVGVISDGVANLFASQATLDLPLAVNVGNVGGGDEGTAMLEIVHDLAPGAALAFYGGGGGSASMITAQNWLANTALSNIIADDLWFPREPYFEDGAVAQNAAMLTTTKGLVYITSAGNRAQRHTQQAYLDGGNRTLGLAGTFRPHDFGGGDVTLDLRLRNPSFTGVRHTIVLQWTEPFGGAGKDFDLYLLDAGMNNILFSSTNPQAGAGDPLEIIDFTWNGPDNTPAFLVVDYAGALPAPTGLTLKIAANGPTFQQYVTAAGSINPHAGHPLVFATGAINQSDPGADSPEGFSSRGPTTIVFPAAETRNKPDAMGIDGVQVTGVGGFPVPFFGTSAASPHAAGIAALLRGAVPALTAAEVRQTLRETAIDVGAPGFDFDTGAGRLDALRALAKYLNEPPVADAGNDTTAECAGFPGTAVKLDGTRSSDPDGDPLTYTWTAPGITFDDPHSATPTATFPLGTTVVTLTVSDGILTDDDEVNVTIADTTPPVVTVSLDPEFLWPPNHKLAPITATVTATDACDATLVVRLVSITSNEPDNGLGDGDTADDIQGAAIGTDDRAFLLRSERQGPADTRIYTVCYEAEDGSGNVGTGCATVTVTHDQSANAAFAAPDDGRDPWQAGGWIEIVAEHGLSAEELTATSPELGGDSFARFALGGDEPVVGQPADEGANSTIDGVPPAPRVRWFVSAAQLQALLGGAGVPTLYARFTVDGYSYLAAATVPGVPAAALAARPSEDAASSTTAPPRDDNAGSAAETESSGTPAHLALAAATPMHAGGTIEYGLPQAGNVLVRLVAPNGRIVARLADGEASAGWHRATLPPNLGSGVYFAIVESGGARALRKVLVLR